MSPVPYHIGGFPPVNIDWTQLLPLIGPANAAIARYEGVLHGIPQSERPALATLGPGSRAVQPD